MEDKHFGYRLIWDLNDQYDVCNNVTKLFVQTKLNLILQISQNLCQIQFCSHECLEHN